MPELPEVQTIVSELDQKLKNKTIKKAEVLAEKSVNLSSKKFKSELAGVEIASVSRRAKMIIISLSNKNFLLIHLKMTGQLIFKSKILKQKLTVGGHPHQAGLVDLPNKFTRVAFEFGDGSKLFFNDIRRFGWVKLVDKAYADEVLGKYGIEPLGPEFIFTSFDKILQKFPKRKIKQILLDQALIAGVGNIYADESCFLAGIMPTRLSGSLTLEERKKLFKAIPKVLKISIEKGGTSADTYVRTDGSKGSMVEFLKVYGRSGEVCKRSKCVGTIKKIRLNGRGTHYCEGCQE